MTQHLIREIEPYNETLRAEKLQTTFPTELTELKN